MAEEQQAESPPEAEGKAREMGWQPKEQWKGNPDNWVGAEEFVKRGETFVPFLQADRKKLKGELAQRDTRLNQVEQELQQTRTQLEEMKTFHTDMAKERKERRKVELGAALKVAREAGDDVKIAELQNELGEAVKPEPVKQETKPQLNNQNQPVIQPWVKSFIEGNEDFFKNARKASLFNAVMLEKRQAGDTRVGDGEGTTLFTEARDEVERILGGNPRRQAPPKTEDGRPPANNGGSGNSGGKSYHDLPSEAKTKCDSQEEKFVGTGKSFKDQAAWRRHYATEYFA